MKSAAAGEEKKTQSLVILPWREGEFVYDCS